MINARERIKNKNGNIKELVEVKTVNYAPETNIRHTKPLFQCPINKIANLYGYPDGINKKDDVRLKEVKSFKNPNIQRKIYWTVLDADVDSFKDIRNITFPKYIDRHYMTKEDAKKEFKDKVSYFDLNNKDLKQDVLKYRKNNEYRPKDKPYTFGKSTKNPQMTITFKNPTKLTSKPYKKQKPNTGPEFIDD